MNDFGSQHDDLVGKLRAESEALEKERDMVIDTISKLDMRPQIKIELLTIAQEIYEKRLGKIGLELWCNLA